MCGDPYKEIGQAVQVVCESEIPISSGCKLEQGDTHAGDIGKVVGI